MTSTSRTALQWGATFLAFPIGGYLARLPGPVDSVAAAAVAGLIAGAVVGGAQSLVLQRDRWLRIRFAAASAVGLAAGLVGGSAAAGFGTTAPDLVLQGVVNGLVLGAAQLVVLLPAYGRRALVWPLLTAVGWGLGWWTTSSIGVDVARQYAVFGASGALVATVVTGLGVVLLTRGRRGVAA